MKNESQIDKFRSFSDLSKYVTKMESKILKKVWGKYFILWGFAFAVYVFAPYPINLIKNPILLLATYSIVYSLVTLCALYITIILFERVSVIFDLKNNSKSRKKEKNSKRLAYALLWGSITVSLVLGFGYFDSVYVFVLVFFILLIIIIFVSKQMAVTYGRIEIEGYIAIGTYILSDAISLFSLVVNLQSNLSSDAWLIACFGWIIAGTKSLFDYRKEMRAVGEKGERDDF